MKTAHGARGRALRSNAMASSELYMAVSSSFCSCSSSDLKTQNISSALLLHPRHFGSNIFAQAGKCRVECIYFPCDTAPELKTLAPSGYVDVYPREVDLENVEKLKKFSDTLTVMSFKELKEAVSKRKKCLKKSCS